MKRNIAYISLAVCLAVNGGLAVSSISRAQDKPVVAKAELKPASSFQSIADEDSSVRSRFSRRPARSSSIRAASIAIRPSDRPLQGMAMHPHQPPVSRGEGGMGMPGMKCNTCHGPENVESHRAGRDDQEHSRQSELASGADRNGLGGQVARRRSASRSRIRSAMAARTWTRSSSTWRMTISSAGAGIRATAASRCPERRKPSAN